MKNRIHRLHWRHGTLCLLIGLFVAMAATIASASPASKTSEPSTTATSERLPGVEIASEFTKVTGIAASPLLGVSAWSAWSYLRASETKRAALPWHCHPAIWGIGLLVVMLAKLKDASGVALPSLVKKPLDMAELFRTRPVRCLRAA